MLVATAEDCLNEATAKYVVFEKTNIRTPLGRIVIIEATTDGLVLVAGPSTNTQMKKVIDKLKKYSPQLILIDGALFRKSIAKHNLASAVILATGASYNRSMKKVVNDTKILVDQLRINSVNDTVKNFVTTLKTPVFFNENFTESESLKGNLLDRENVLQKYVEMSYSYLYIPGALTDEIINVFIDNRHKFNKMNIILDDSTHILVSPEVFHKLDKIGLKISVLNQIEILFIAYNPFSPFGYEFDNDEFRENLLQNTELDVINVLKDLE